MIPLKDTNGNPLEVGRRYRYWPDYGNMEVSEAELLEWAPDADDAPGLVDLRFSDMAESTSFCCCWTFELVA